MRMVPESRCEQKTNLLSAALSLLKRPPTPEPAFPRRRTDLSCRPFDEAKMNNPPGA
jgi:hypothetical protein